jgi:hypothetical protein
METMKRIQIIEKLAEHYSRKLNGKVWAAWDEQKRMYSIRGEGLPAHPDLQSQYPNGWSMLDYISPSDARKLLGIISHTKRDSKRILSVTIKRMIDDSTPDTSHLGKYSRNPESEFSIDRKHTVDCASQKYNRANNESVNRLQRVLEYLWTRGHEIGNRSDDLYYWGIDRATDIISDAQDAVTECDCDESGNWSYGELQYFNPSFNYVDKFGNALPENTPDDVINYTRADYERMESYNNGDWQFIGIRAEAEYAVNGTIQTARSGGLWGIESDSDGAHLVEVEQEELAELRSTLYTLGFSKRAISEAFKDVTREDV